MGGLCSKESEYIRLAKAHTKNIDRELERDNIQDKKILKLLLLGAGESGKSTLFKQLKTIYNDHFKQEDERKPFEMPVYSNIYSAMTRMINYAESKGWQIQPQNRASRDVVINMNHNTDKFDGKQLNFGPEMAQHIACLWLDTSIKKAYADKAQYNLFDSCEYFMNKVKEIGKDGYIPSADDVYRCRTRTTGIAQVNFSIKNNQQVHNFEMYDVGGQRQERRKWIRCFEKVTAIIFVAALSGYNQVVLDEEDGKTIEINRMDESLNLFEEIVGTDWFDATSIILFLNKSDLFKQQLPRFPLKDNFPDYEGDNSFDDAKTWIENLYLSCVEDEDAQNNSIYTHVTCATDTNNIRVVFDIVKDGIIQANLTKSGLSAE